MGGVTYMADSFTLLNRLCQTFVVSNCYQIPDEFDTTMLDCSNSHLSNLRARLGSSRNIGHVAIKQQGTKQFIQTTNSVFSLFQSLEFFFSPLVCLKWIQLTQRATNKTSLLWKNAILHQWITQAKRGSYKKNFPLWKSALLHQWISLTN